MEWEQIAIILIAVWAVMHSYMDLRQKQKMEQRVDKLEKGG